MNTNRIRSKWAAVGAAIAVSLGAGGIGISHATTSSGERPIYLPIEPCRLADTRPAFQVGPRSAPLGPTETYDLSGWGTVGDCTLPNDTAGLALNVTPVDPTAPTFLTFFPSGVPLPLASNLNPTPGQPPTPNAVNVDLNAAGVFSVYNLAGNVHVAIDVVGIYDDHNHDDRYYTEAEIDGALAATKFINLPAIFNVETDDSDSPYGSGFLDATVMLPPDYTPGAPLILRVNMIASDDPCTVQLRGNYAYIFRDGLGNVDDNGGSVSGAITDPAPVAFATTAGRASRTIDIAVGAPGTIPLQPNDGISLGLFFGGATTCADAHVHAAMLLYS